MKKDSIYPSVRTGEITPKNFPMSNILKIADLFTVNYKYHKLQKEETEMSIDDQNKLIELASVYGELQLINLLANDAVIKDKIIRDNLN